MDIITGPIRGGEPKYNFYFLKEGFLRFRTESSSGLLLAARNVLMHKHLLLCTIESDKSSATPRAVNSLSSGDFGELT